MPTLQCARPVWGAILLALSWVLAAAPSAAQQKPGASASQVEDLLHDACPHCELIGGGSPPPLQPVSAAADASRPFLVKIHADWCLVCVSLEPTWRELQRRLGGDARLVVLDVTDGEALARSRKEALRLGLLPFLRSHQTRTGTIAVLDGASRRVLREFHGERRTAPYEAAVAEAALLPDLKQ